MANKKQSTWKCIGVFSSKNELFKEIEFTHMNEYKIEIKKWEAGFGCNRNEYSLFKKRRRR
jgi:hypothetical protein